MYLVSSPVKQAHPQKVVLIQFSLWISPRLTCFGEKHMKSRSSILLSFIIARPHLFCRLYTGPNRFHYFQTPLTQLYRAYCSKSRLRNIGVSFPLLRIIFLNPFFPNEMISSSGSLARFSHLSYSIERKAGASRHPAAYFNIWLARERRRARGSQAPGVDAPSEGGIWSEACNFTLSPRLSRGKSKDFWMRWS